MTEIESGSNNAVKDVCDSRQTPPCGKPIGMNWDDDLSMPKAKPFWEGLDGLSVTVFGVALPALLFLASCATAPKRLTLVLLNHPLETLAELALVSSIPLINYLVWSSICRSKNHFSRKVIVALGAAIGTSTILALISMAGSIVGASDLASSVGSEFSTGFFWIAIVSMLAGAISLYLANRIRLSRELSQSRQQVIIFSIAGAVLSALVFLGAECRPWLVRFAERMAVSASASDRHKGMNLLRQINPERELRMECSDPRATGLPGLFIPIKSNTQHQLYFALTGKPFNFADDNNSDLSSMPDEYLSTHVVGEKVNGLLLTRSLLSGTVHPETLTSTVNWTFVLKNETASAQEGRAEISLPPGAAITGLTVWNNGEPEDAQFVASGKVDGVAMSNAGHDSRAMATDLGHGRVLVHCYPVRPDEELKIRASMVVPLKPDTNKVATLAIPKLVATNFGLSGDQQFRFRSSSPLKSNLKTLVAGMSRDKQQVLSGDLSDDQLGNANLIVTAERTEIYKPVAVLDRLAVQIQQEEQRKLEQARKEASKTTANNNIGEVVVMIDGSKGVQQQIEDIHQALARKHSGSPDSQPRIRTVQSRYLVQDITRVAAPAPKHLVVVIDGSAIMKDYLKEVSAALCKLPAGIPVSVIVACQEDRKLMQPVDLASAMNNLKHVQFCGGQDNLQAVIKAAELAGETRGGAVLWIHGPQPVTNQEIYIMAPYVATPSFYELALGTATDTDEFFKNHSEVGPFAQVPRNTCDLFDDLSTFFSKWQPDSDNYAVALAQVSSKPADSITASPEEAQELLALYAQQETARLVSTRAIHKAAVIAVNYHIVSPVSSALVSPDTAAEAKDSNGSETASSLQGATNGTIGPQGGDATVVQGVNTSGTVRVNNLANLEALLNIFANLGEIGGIVLGAFLVISGVMRTLPIRLGENLQIGTRAKVIIGIALVVFALAIPGCINWFVASARDANLFS